MDNTLSQICDLLLLIVKSIVDHPSAVVLSTRTEETPKIVELRVAQPDLGRLIGKKGQTVEAVRSIITAIAHKMDYQSVKVHIDALPSD